MATVSRSCAPCRPHRPHPHRPAVYRPLRLTRRPHDCRGRQRPLACAGLCRVFSGAEARPLRDLLLWLEPGAPLHGSMAGAGLCRSRTWSLSKTTRRKPALPGPITNARMCSPKAIRENRRPFSPMSCRGATRATICTPRKSRSWPWPRSSWRFPSRGHCA